MNDKETYTEAVDELKEAITYLREEFDRALKLDFVESPIAYALYYTWQRYDEKLKEKKIRRIKNGRNIRRGNQGKK